MRKEIIIQLDNSEIEDINLVSNGKVEEKLSKSVYNFLEQGRKQLEKRLVENHLSTTQKQEYKMTLLPNYLIVQILRNLINFCHRIKYLNSFLVRFTLVSKDWNQNVIPKLHCTNTLNYEDGIEQCSKRQFQRIIKSGVTFELSFIPNRTDTEDVKYLVKDLTTKLSGERLYRNFDDFPKIKLIKLSVYNDLSGLEFLDHQYLIDKGINLDISAIPDPKDTPTFCRTLLTLPNIITLFLMDIQHCLKFTKDFPSISTLTNLTLFTITFTTIEDFYAIIDNATKLNFLDIEKIDFSKVISNPYDKIIERIVNSPSSKTLNNLNLGNSQGSISYSSILMLIQYLVKLTRLSLFSEKLIVDSYNQPTSSGKIQYMSLEFDQIDSPTFDMLDIFSHFSLLSLSISPGTLYNNDLTKDFCSRPIFRDLSTLTITRLLNCTENEDFSKQESLTTYFINKVISANIKSLTSMYLSGVKDDSPFIFKEFKESLQRNTSLTHLNFNHIDIDNCIEFLENSPPTIRKIQVKILDMLTSSFSRLIKPLQNHKYLLSFDVNRCSVSCDIIPLYLEILKHNKTLTSLQFPTSYSKDVVTPEQLSELKIILNSNDQINTIRTNNDEFLALLTKYMCKDNCY
ncbi:hypothetical protein DLAC_11065 [Tieghemostelium lacteum]|uniref:Uncharacterized protein n=1 Tax=Tieghemostelium lacteum TaxID=361077 RepID=A0A151Z369_TIELA|nr:hypothetical protein DLAC_11065 [Tieghemostelium lacteum]|eukprot:KYQ88367.1 hypothetical protein DLAC_11065 [Tieghemostelium lacteum]